MTSEAATAGRNRGVKVLLDAALDTMPYGFSMWDLDRRLAASNPRYLDIYKYRAEDIRPGMSLLELCRLSTALGNHPGLTAEELHEIYQRRFDQSQQGEPLFSEKAIRGLLIRTSHSFIPDVGWVVRHEDVTEATEKQWLADLREKALQKQDQRRRRRWSRCSGGPRRSVPPRAAGKTWRVHFRRAAFGNRSGSGTMCRPAADPAG